MRQVLFKNPDIQRELTQLDKRLYPILSYMSDYAWGMHEELLVVTRIFEKDDSTHSNPKPYRFIDLAILEAGIEASEILKNKVNDKFPYGVKGYSTIPKLEHGTGPHYHIQVRPL